MQRFSFQRVLIAAALALAFMTHSAGNVRADNYTINWTDSGWYDSTGLHNSGNKNYIIGNYNNQNYNHFMVFDLAGVSGVVVSAQLRLTNPAPVENPGPTRTYEVYDVSTPINTLRANSPAGAAGQAIYTDLATGTLLGSNPGPFGSNALIATNLNAASLTYIQAALGNLIAFGGHYAIPAGENLDFNYLYGWTNDPQSQWTRQLVIETRRDVVVPAPAGMLLAGFGLIGLGGFSFLRRRKQSVAE